VAEAAEEPERDGLERVAARAAQVAGAAEA
jgi:predicted regulator of Ras-like GTPase activity (Roadblock/LC7/MglB family)